MLTSSSNQRRPQRLNAVTAAEIDEARAAVAIAKLQLAEALRAHKKMQSEPAEAMARRSEEVRATRRACAAARRAQAAADATLARVALGLLRAPTAVLEHGAFDQLVAAWRTLRAALADERAHLEKHMLPLLRDTAMCRCLRAQAAAANHACDAANHVKRRHAELEELLARPRVP